MAKCTQLLFIGELAQRCGVSTKTLRHYEALGLLGPVRRQGTYRVFEQSAVHRVAFIRTAQGLGYRLAELQSAMQQQTGGEPPWPAILVLIDQKQAALKQHMETLARQSRELAEHRLAIEQCLEQDPDCKQPLYPT